MTSRIYTRPIIYTDQSTRTRMTLIWRSTTLYILFASAVVWLLGYRYFTAASARDPTSYFFNPTRGHVRTTSLEREKQAYIYVESQNATSNAPPALAQDPTICVGVATVSRPSKDQYVAATIGSLLFGLSDTQRSSIQLTTFIAHLDPETHPVYHQPWLRAMSNKILTYDIPSEDMAQLRVFEEQHAPRNKSMYDYGYLLNDCYKSGAKYIAIIEDDVVARAGWYDEALSALHQIERDMGRQQWLFMRMFYTEIFLGWNIDNWPRYLGASLTIFVSIFFLLMRSRPHSRFLRRHLSTFDIGIICCVTLPAFITLYFMAGCVTVQPLRSGVRRMNRDGCCSQGFIFPREIVPQVYERTKEAIYEDLYIDMLFERYGLQQNLPAFVYIPSLLQHVGLKSSKGGGYDKNAGEIFNFGFET